MTFKEISAWILLAVLIGLYGTYVISAPAATTPDAALALFVRISVAMAVLLIALHIVVSIAHRPEKADERDRTISAKAYRNAYFVGMSGVAFAIAQLLIPQEIGGMHILTNMPPAVAAAHILVLTMAVAELVNVASRIVYYRLGA